MKNIGWILLGIIGVQCTTPKTKARIAEIDALSQKVDSCSQALSVIQFDTVQAYYNRVNHQMASIQELAPDSISFELSQYLGMYYNNSKTFKKISKGYLPLLDEITVTKQQLSNLQHDVINDLVPDSSYQVFFDNEKRMVDRIAFEAGNYVTWQEKGINRYRGMHVKIDSILVSFANMH